jgi:hypothetical protein
MLKRVSLAFLVSILVVACGGSNDAPLPPPPSAPTAVTQEGIKLSWPAVAGATGYAVYASCGSQTRPCTEADKISTTQLTGTTFDLDYNNPTHVSSQFRVAACNAGGCGALSNTSNAAVIASLAMSAAAATEVIEGQTVSLLGRASPKKGKTVASWQWSRFGNDGDPSLGREQITIVNADKQNASFVAPKVSQPTRYAFMLLATDSAGAAGSEIVVTTVRPIDAPIVSVVNKKMKALAGNLVYLNAIGSDSAGTYSWKQINPEPLKTTVAEPTKVLLQNANTANPSFVAPAAPTGVATLAFQVTHTSAQGKSASATVNVTVTGAPLKTMTEAALAGTLNNPLTIMPSSGKKSVPPQVSITLYANPDVTVISGATTQLSINATGGNGVKRYSWRQIGGTTAKATGTDTPILGITAPAVSVAEVLSFELTVTDSVGKTAKGIALATVYPAAIANPPIVATVANATPPLVVSSGNASSVTTGGKTSLTMAVSGGSGQYAWAWTQVGGTRATITNNSSPTLGISAPLVSSPETLTFQYSVTDQRSGEWARGNVQVNVTMPVLAVPALNVQLTPDATVVASGSTSVSLGATGGRGAYSWSWKQTGGTAAKLGNTNGANLSITAPAVTAAEALTFEGTVTDSSGLSAKGVVKVNVTVPAPVVQPIALFAPPPTPVNVGNTTTLSFGVTGGSGTYTWAWKQVSGTAATLGSTSSANLSVTAPNVAVAETLGFEVTVTDSGGLTAKGTAKVNVAVPVVVTPPVITPISLQPAPDSTVVAGSTIQVTMGIAGGKAPFTWSWKQVSGPNGFYATIAGGALSLTAPPVAVDEVLTFEATVTDSAGQTAKGTAKVTATVPFSVINLTNQDTSVPAGNATIVQLPARGGNGALTWVWRQSGGPTADSLNGVNNAAFIVSSSAKATPGSIMTFEATVTDARGQVVKGTATVVITSAPPVVVPPPVIAKATDVPAQASGSQNLTLEISGGTPPYTWSWKQTGGTSATLTTAATAATLGITAPVVKVAEVLTFEGTATDSTGKTTTGTVKVNVNPPVTGTALPSVTLPMSQMIAGQTIPIKGFASDVSSVVLTQRGGRPGNIAKISEKEWSFTAPAAGAAQSETLGLAIQMNYTNGTSKTLRLPIQLLSPTGVTTLPPNAGWVVAPPDAPLALDFSNPRVDEGAKDASISANASGGTLNYTYSWTYIPDTGSPYTAASLNLRPNGNHLVFDAPTLPNGGINLKFLVKVDDGKSFTSKTMIVNINDLGSVVASNGNDLRVPSGQMASLSFPAPSGGVPPYSYAVTQVSGTTVALTGANTLSPAFTAPTLAQGAASTQLAFEMTVTDAVGNTVKARENVAVEAPVRFKVTLDAVNGPVTPGTAFNLHASAAGTSVAPITYTWAFFEGRTDVTSQLTLTGATTDNPGVTVPAALAGKTLRVGVSATDSTTPTAQKGVASPSIILQVGAAPAVALPPLSLSFIAPSGAVPVDTPFDVTYAVTQADPSVQFFEDCSLPGGVDFNPPSMTIPAQYAGQTVTVTCTVEDENNNQVSGSISLTVDAAAAVPQGPAIDQTRGQALSCQVCDGKLCIIAESTDPVPAGQAGICMTTLIDDTNFQRRLIKRIVDEATAMSLWWNQTSDNNGGCMSIFDDQSPPNGQAVTCHYACVTTGCNSDIFPAKSTLFDGN